MRKTVRDESDCGPLKMGFTRVNADTRVIRPVMYKTFVALSFRTAYIVMLILCH